jgi:transcriptional regulator with XRE-family HTH domain
MDGSTSFGEWLRSRRTALQLSREQLAQRVGCAAVTLRKIEADERRRRYSLPSAWRSCSTCRLLRSQPSSALPALGSRSIPSPHPPRCAYHLCCRVER